jgi:hypothetical protein
MSDYCEGLTQKYHPCPYTEQCGVCINITRPEDDRERYAMGRAAVLSDCIRDFPLARKYTRHEFYEVYRKLPLHKRAGMPIMSILEAGIMSGVIVD